MKSAAGSAVAAMRTVERLDPAVGPRIALSPTCSWSGAIVPRLLKGGVRNGV